MIINFLRKKQWKIPSKGNWRFGPDHRSNYRLRTSSKTPKSWPIIFVYHRTTLQEKLSKWTFFADQSRLLNDVKQVIRDVGDQQNSQHGKPLPLIKDMKKLFQGLHFEEKMLLTRADRSSHGLAFVVKRRTKRTLTLGLTVVSRSPRSKYDQGKTKETGTSHDNDGRSSKLKKYISISSNTFIVLALNNI